MAGTEETRRTVGDAVKGERLRIKYSVEAAASSGKMSHMTWRRIEKGAVVQERSYHGVDKALYLPAGTTLLAVHGELDLAERFKANAEQRYKIKALQRDRRILTDKLATDPPDPGISQQLESVNRQLSNAEDEHSRMTGYTPWEVRASKKAAVEGAAPVELVDTVAPALKRAGQQKTDHEGSDARVTLVERIADLGLDDLYRLRDMVDGAIAVQERDPSRRRSLHASQAIREAFRKLDLIKDAIGEARGHTEDPDDLADIEKVEQATKRMANNLAAVEGRHPELEEVHELADRLTKELKNLGQR